MTPSGRSPSVALERGKRFLLATQGPDGLWREFLTPAGEASEWPTGFIATALYHARAETTALERAAETLIARQHDDGGWGYNETVPTDADSTACVLLFLARMGRGSSTYSRADACLVRHQRQENGGIATYREPGPIRRFMGIGRWMRFHGWCSPHVEVTAMAGRALGAIRPSHYRPEADAAWQYVRSRQRPDGSWGAYWWTSPHYATFQAVELAISLGERDPVDRAAEWVLRSQADDGGWSAPGAEISAFATALSLSVLLRAGASRCRIERAVSRLIALQDDDGGWPQHPIMRIPLPGDTDPDRRRRFMPGGLRRGLSVADQHRTFASAACVAALACACDTMS
jgi:squalene-hopene/tetraprenyl-beta-curcumene cyclase